MSRIGRMPIVVPAGVDVKIDGQHVTVKGGKAELSLDVHPDITVKLEDGQITVTRPSDDKNHRSLHGLTRALIQNMVTGVHEGFSKTLAHHHREDDGYHRRGQVHIRSCT